MPSYRGQIALCVFCKDSPALFLGTLAKGSLIPQARFVTFQLEGTTFSFCDKVDNRHANCSDHMTFKPNLVFGGRKTRAQPIAKLYSNGLHPTFSCVQYGALTPLH